MTFESMNKLNLEKSMNTMHNMYSQKFTNKGLESICMHSNSRPNKPIYILIIMGDNSLSM